MSITKPCLVCKEIKELSLFNFSNKTKTRRCNVCRKCKQSRKKELNLSREIVCSIPDLDGEIWKNIKGYHGNYLVSNCGRVKSINRIVVHNREGILIETNQRGRIHKDACNGNGYRYVTISYSNRRKNHYVHRLVAEAFASNHSVRKHVNHKNGDKSNNRIENLEWVTRSENMLHAYQTGLNLSGSDKPNAIKVYHIGDKKVFGCIKEAAVFYNIKYGLLKEALRRDTPKKRDVYKNLIYLDKYTELI